MNYNPLKEKHPKYRNFGDYLYYAYANFQMFWVAYKQGKRKFDEDSIRFRASAFKKFRDGIWTINNLLRNNIAKIECNDICWYCGKEMKVGQLSVDHVFPRSKGGTDDMDNIIMCCQSCNSSKADKDLMDWYNEREEFPPYYVIALYLKLIYKYAVEHELLDKYLDQIDNMDLPFNWKTIPMFYPNPEDYFDLDDNEV